MAESGEASSTIDQLRSSLFPILIGLMGPSSEASPDRLILVNPLTQGMIILRGDSDTINEILASGGGGRSGTPPASKESIEGLKAVEAEELGEEEECAVCLDGLKEREEEEDGERVKEMPCRHRFHGGCIGKWLGMHGSCPVCRFAMPVEERDGSKKEEGREEEESRRGRGTEVWVTIAVRRGEEEGEDQQERSDEQREV